MTLGDVEAASEDPMRRWLEDCPESACRVGEEPNCYSTRVAGFPKITAAWRWYNRFRPYPRPLQFDPTPLLPSQPLQSIILYSLRASLPTFLNCQWHEITYLTVFD